jgi:pantoate--beta-alanine ligase
MIIYKTEAELADFLDLKRQKAHKIGFVPTMGALHAGHISLIEASKSKTELTVISIFVNPTQFNNEADFANYPITIEKDVQILEKAGCDVLFLPLIAEIYPQGTANLPRYELGFVETVLEGKYRPGHFQGVCQVVHRLLQMVQPHLLFLGQKDYQQCMVIKKMIALTGLPTHIQICPTLREPHGLAMSSRNVRLNDIERKQAVQIWQTLNFVKKNIRRGDLTALKQQATAYLNNNGFKTDYVEIANADYLQLQDKWDGKTPLVILVAAFLNEVRLIDNMVY